MKKQRNRFTGTFRSRVAQQPTRLREEFMTTKTQVGQSERRARHRALDKPLVRKSRGQLLLSDFVHDRRAIILQTTHGPTARQQYVTTFYGRKTAFEVKKKKKQFRKNNKNFNVSRPRDTTRRDRHAPSSQ